MRLILSLFLVVASSAQVAQKKPPPESFLQWLLRITGISATSIGLKGNGPEFPGDIWIAPTGQAGAQRWTFEGRYSWPVFSQDDKAIIALRDGDLWSVPLDGGEPAKLPHSPSGIVGIVGTGPYGIVLFTKTEIGVFAPDSGTFTPFVPATQEDRDAIARMRLPARSYGDDFTVRQFGADIMIEKNGTKSEITAEGDRFGQPSVSHDRTHIVYVRTRK